MNNDNNQNKIYYIIGALVILLIIIYSAYIILKNTRTKIGSFRFGGHSTPSYKSIDDLPMLSNNQDVGVDIQSNFIQESISTIASLDQYLPYQKILTTEDGVDIEVLIVSTKFTDNNWTLNAFVFGPDYQIPNDNPQYPVMKKAFLIGVDNVFTFLKEKNVDTSKVIIQWGDRKFVRDRAKEWLD